MSQTSNGSSDSHLQGDPLHDGTWQERNGATPGSSGGLSSDPPQADGEQGPAASDDELFVEFGAEVTHPLELERLLRIVARICIDHGIDRGQLSFTVVGDQRMHELNREVLEHDYPTDVISFDYVEPEERGERVEGEIIVNADYAAREAPEHGHDQARELLLYCIHGTLHVLGYDDQDPDGAETMAELQEQYLRKAHES